MLASGCQTTRGPSPEAKLEAAVVELAPCPPPVVTEYTLHSLESFEAPPTYLASELIPYDLLGGPHHQVREIVHNDGLMHHFCIQSEFGTFHALGPRQAGLRVAEVYAIAELQALSNAGAFGRGAGDATVSLVTSPFRGVVRIIRNPLHLLAIIPAPVAVAVGAVRSTQQLIEMGFTEEYAKTVVGYYSARRNLAERYGVRADSDNPVLNASLDAVAWEFYAGGLPMDVAERFVPVPGVPRVQAFEGAQGSAAPIADAAADRLLARDAGTRMRRMDINGDTRRALNEHLAFDGGARGGFVAALWEMEDLENRQFAIEEALATPDRHAAIALRREFEMLAAYDERVAPLTKIVTVHPFASARRFDGKLVIAVYAHHAAWTASTAHRFRELRECLAGTEGIDDAEVWLSGPATPMIKTQLAALGWTPYADARFLLDDTPEEDEEPVLME